MNNNKSHIVFKCYYLLFEVVSRHFVIFHNTRDLKLSDAISKRNELRCNAADIKNKLFYLTTKLYVMLENQL